MNRREVERVEWCFIHMPILLIDLEKSKHIHICSLSFSHRVFRESAGLQISWDQRRGNSWNGQATSLNPCTQLTSHVSCCSATLLVATKNLVHCKWAHSLEKLYVLPTIRWALNVFFRWPQCWPTYKAETIILDVDGMNVANCGSERNDITRCWCRGCRRRWCPSSCRTRRTAARSLAHLTKKHRMWHSGRDHVAKSRGCGIKPNLALANLSLSIVAAVAQLIKLPELRSLKERWNWTDTVISQ